jgi:hypothetical protein
LKNEIFKIKIWSFASENTCIIFLRFAHQKWHKQKKEKKLV